MKLKREFFTYVIPSIIAFALSGVYSIVDGFFVGNTIGDIGLSAINIAYPVEAAMQAVGTGIGMGGAVHYSICLAQGKEKEAKEYAAAGVWLLLVFSFLITVLVFGFSDTILRFLGAKETIHSYASDYIRTLAFGTVLQILGTGLVPFVRNYGGAYWAMAAMMGGFASNILLDYLLVWRCDLGMKGAAIATVLGQGMTVLVAAGYAIREKKLYLRIAASSFRRVCGGIFRVGIAPFGLALTPNISLILINRFSAVYGGEQAIATYACISYVICVIYLILQGVGDGSQPLMSRYYGGGDAKSLRSVQKMAYAFAVLLAAIGTLVMFLLRAKIGVMFGASARVNQEISRIMPIFLVSVPFVAITRIATAFFYATEKSTLSYILTFIEPVLIFVLLLILPHFGGQLMVWWSSVLSRVMSAALAVILTVFLVNGKKKRLS